MEGLLDHSLRDALTKVGGVDRCVSEFIRVTGTLLPCRAFERVVPELFQEAANGPQLGQALLDWFEQPTRIAALEERFLGIHQQLRRDASARAAEAVLAVAGRKRGTAEARNAP